MDEGAFRILRALVDGRSHDRLTALHEAGESPSVLRSLLESHPEWFEADASQIRVSAKGLAALARELVERSPSGLLVDQGDEDGRLVEVLRVAGTKRGRVKRELDQVWATVETSLARARMLITAGEVQRGLCFLGDDDMTSLAVHLLGVSRRVTVVDIDPDLLALYQEEANRGGWEHQGIAHDLRDPLPSQLRGRFGCVFTDPPYAPEGFELFVNRAIELLRPDGRLYVCFGVSRRASERGLQKQRILTEAGLLVESVWEDFNRYHGASSLGGRSSLWRCRRTDATKPTRAGRDDRALYSRRPQKKPQ